MMPFPYRRVLLVCGLCTWLGLALHLLPINNTMLNYVDKANPNPQGYVITDGFLPWAVDYHKTLPDFKKRPLTTLFIDAFSLTLGLRVSHAFVLVNFLLTFGCGVLVYHLGRVASYSARASLTGAVLFLCSFSVLFAYFIPIATYDEPIQYLFIFGALIAHFTKRKILFITALALALIARESTMLILPGFVLLTQNLNPPFRLNKRTLFFETLLPISIALLAYFVYLTLFYHLSPESQELSEDYLKRRFSIFERNFGGLGNTMRTGLSLFSVFFVPFVLMALRRTKAGNVHREANSLLAFWVTFVLNTTIVFIAVFAEEARVLALPLVFLYPAMGRWFEQLIPPWHAWPAVKLTAAVVLIALVLSAAFWCFLRAAYQLTDLNMHNNLYEEYHALSFFILAVVVLAGKVNHLRTVQTKLPR